MMKPTETINLPALRKMITTHGALDEVREEANNRLIWGTGPLPAMVAVVGDAPTADLVAQQTGVPMSGPRWRALWDGIALVGGRDAGSCYRTTVFKYRMPEYRAPTSSRLWRTDDQVDLVNAGEWDVSVYVLLQELDLVSPILTVAAGFTAARALGISRTSMPAYGEITRSHGRAVLPVHDPSDVFTGRATRAEYLQQFRPISDFLARDTARRRRGVASDIRPL